MRRLSHCDWEPCSGLPQGHNSQGRSCGVGTVRIWNLGKSEVHSSTMPLFLYDFKRVISCSESHFLCLWNGDQKPFSLGDSMDSMDNTCNTQKGICMSQVVTSETDSGKIKWLQTVTTWNFIPLNFLITVANLKALHVSFFIPDNLPKCWVHFRMEPSAHGGALGPCLKCGYCWWLPRPVMGWKWRRHLPSLSQHSAQGV